MEGIVEIVFRFVIEGLFIGNIVEDKPYFDAFLKFIMVTIVFLILMGIISYIRGWTMGHLISKLIYPPLIGIFAAVVSLVSAKWK